MRGFLKGYYCTAKEPRKKGGKGGTLLHCRFKGGVRFTGSPALDGPVLVGGTSLARVSPVLANFGILPPQMT